MKINFKIKLFTINRLKIEIIKGVSANLIKFARIRNFAAKP